MTERLARNTAEPDRNQREGAVAFGMRRRKHSDSVRRLPPAVPDNPGRRRRPPHERKRHATKARRLCRPHHPRRSPGGWSMKKVVIAGYARSAFAPAKK